MPYPYDTNDTSIWGLMQPTGGGGIRRKPRGFLSGPLPATSVPPAAPVAPNVPAVNDQIPNPMPAPEKNPSVDPIKLMSDEPTKKKFAGNAAKMRILPPRHAQPQQQSPVPAAPAPAQQQPVAGILPPMANSVFPNFGIQPQQSFDLQGTPATAVGDTNTPAMQLDPANLAVLGQSLGSSSPASAAMNPAAIQALARVGQGVVQSNNPQFVPANPRPVEMPGRASVALGNDSDKILAMILARSQGQAVPGLSQLVGKL